MPDADQQFVSGQSSFWRLRRGDQLVIATLVAVGIGSMLTYFAYMQRQRGVIDIERAPPLVAKFQVDVNSADWVELSQLPNVGRSLAERIVHSRRTNGPFRTWDDLARVHGIGPRTLEQMKPYLLPIAGSQTAASR